MKVTKNTNSYTRTEPQHEYAKVIGDSIVKLNVCKITLFRTKHTIPSTYSYKCKLIIPRVSSTYI